MSAARAETRPRWDGDTRGSEVAALATAVVLSVATVEVLMVGHLRLFFDLWFVLVCLGAALMVRPRDFFTVGVLPPLVMFATMVLAALNGPAVVGAARDGRRAGGHLRAGAPQLRALRRVRRVPGHPARPSARHLSRRGALSLYSSKRLTSPAPSRTISG